jgi:hypothetical protein
MKKSEIETEIDFKVGITSYEIWRIGLAQELSELKKHLREKQKHDINYWAEWEADSLSDAREIESQFIKRGMKAGTGNDLSTNKPVYVYIY